MMRHAVYRSRRRAYLVVAALATLAIVVGVQVVLARAALFDFERDRQTSLQTRAEQVFESARAWSDRHGAQIGGDAATILALDQLLPETVDGDATLRRVWSATNDELIACEVTLRRARTRFHQVVYWPPGATAAPSP